MVYTKQTWTNSGASGGLGVTDEVNAERLGYMEEGIETAQQTAEAAISDLDYANAAPGTRFSMLYTASGGGGFLDPATATIAAARPSARTDIYFDLIGGTSAVADPAWMINGDAREVTV